jgi:nicotinamidase/pyrazinamidase
VSDRYRPGTALLVVDVQNDFADPRGSLYVRGAEEIVPIVNREIERAVSESATVVYTQDWHPAVTKHFRQYGGTWPVHCVKESWGAAFHEDLLMSQGQIVRKGSDGGDGYSGFSVWDPVTEEVSSTTLAPILQEHGVTRVVIAGLATDYCVVETTLDGIRLGFEVTVLTPATRAVNLRYADGIRAIERMREAGAQIVE